MPLYEYQCEACSHRFEVIQKFSDAPIATCPKCDGPVRKLLSSPAIQFKGSGWYITDYARKDSGGGKAGTKSDESKSAASTTETTSSESSTKDSKKDSAASGSSSGGTKSSAASSD